MKSVGTCGAKTDTTVNNTYQIAHDFGGAFSASWAHKNFHDDIACLPNPTLPRIPVRLPAPIKARLQVRHIAL
jgi:hypothetical protein